MTKRKKAIAKLAARLQALLKKKEFVYLEG